MRKMIKKLMLCVLGISCLSSALLTPLSIKANEIQEEKEVPVYTVNDEGDVVLADIDSNFLLQLMGEKNNISSRQIPGPEGNSIRIGDIKYGVIDRAAIAGSVLSFVAGAIWAYYGGSIVNKFTNSRLGKATWDVSVGGVASNLINKFTNGGLRKAYSAGYMYKSWNSYYGCYELFYSEAQYSDPGRTKLVYFLHYKVGSAGL